MMNFPKVKKECVIYYFGNFPELLGLLHHFIGGVFCKNRKGRLSLFIEKRVRKRIPTVCQKRRLN
ncbi:MAG: hypothetical protein C6W56_15040 [Caldibacillus debilis]|nr:MAG: hypothetical protein C6W56_15040 [Caldibacillus debilis]